MRRQATAEASSSQSDSHKGVAQRALIIRSNQKKLHKLLFQCRGDVNGALKILGSAYPHLSFSVKETQCAGGIGQVVSYMDYQQLLDILQGGALTNTIFDNVEEGTFDDILIIDGQSIVATLEVMGKARHVPAALNLLRLAVNGVRHNQMHRNKQLQSQTENNDILHRQDMGDKNELRQVYRATISLLGHAHNRQSGTKQSSSLVMHLLHHHIPKIGQIQPGTEIYHAAINALGKIGERGVIFELLDEMENSCKESMRKENEIIAPMAKTASPVDKMAYQTAISSLARNNYCNEAMQLLCRMQSKGLSPDINTYNQLLIGIAKESGRVAADRKSNTNIEDGSVAIPWHKMALQLLHEMERTQLRVTDQIYDSVTSTCTNEGELNMAARISGKAVLQRHRGKKRKFSSIDDGSMSEEDIMWTGTPSEGVLSSNTFQHAAIAYFDNLKVFCKCGKSSETWWEIGRYITSCPSNEISVSDGHDRSHGRLRSIIIGIQPHKNPFRNGLSLVFFDEESRVKLGRLLMRNESSHQTVRNTNQFKTPFFSSLVGMEVNKEWRGEGLSKIFAAIWLRICLDTNTYPRAAVMNKPLISRVLMGFNFVPQNGGSRVELIRLNSDSKTEKGDTDYNPQFALYSPSAKSLKGLFSQRALRLQNIVILDHPPSPTSRQNASIIYVKSEFEHPIAILENAVQYNPPSSLLDDNVSFFKDMEDQTQRGATGPCEIQRDKLSMQITTILKINTNSSSASGNLEFFSNTTSLKVAFLSDDILYSSDALSVSRGRDTRIQTAEETMRINERTLKSPCSNFY